jgi:hypothetical protein
MASSSKGRASSRKQSSAGKARVISTKRKDALPRTGGVSVGRRKPVVLPPIDALMEPLATAVAAPKKKSHRLHQKEPTASRKKTARAAGRGSAKLEPVADTVSAVEPPVAAYEVFVVAAREAPEVEALAVVETELEVEASAIIEELPVEAETAPSIAIGPPPIPEETRAPPLARTTAQSPAPAPPAPHHERRSLTPAISRLLSALCRWTGVSGTK